MQWKDIFKGNLRKEPVLVDMDNSRRKRFPGSAEGGKQDAHESDKRLTDGGLWQANPSASYKWQRFLL